MVEWLVDLAHGAHGVGGGLLVALFLVEVAVLIMGIAHIVRDIRRGARG